MNRELLLISAVAAISLAAHAEPAPSETSGGPSTSGLISSAKDVQLRADALIKESRKRQETLQKKTEEIVDRSKAIMKRQEEQLARQEKQLDRFDKILSRWEKQQAEFQRYLNTLPKK